MFNVTFQLRSKTTYLRKRIFIKVFFVLMLNTYFWNLSKHCIRYTLYMRIWKKKLLTSIHSRICYIWTKMTPLYVCQMHVSELNANTRSAHESYHRTSSLHFMCLSSCTQPCLEFIKDKRIKSPLKNYYLPPLFT